MIRVLTLLSLVLAAGSDTLSVRVSPASFFSGSSVTVVCHVPRRATNRSIRGALYGYSSSDRQMDGESAPITYRFEFKKVPCGVEQAGCIVTDAYNQQKEAVASVVVAGCDGAP